MIRERVSTRDNVPARARGGPSGIQAIPQRVVGVIPESVLERYTAAQQPSDQRFASTIKGIEKARTQHRACKPRPHATCCGAAAVFSRGTRWCK